MNKWGCIETVYVPNYIPSIKPMNFSYSFADYAGTDPLSSRWHVILEFISRQIALKCHCSQLSYETIFFKSNTRFFR